MLRTRDISCGLIRSPLYPCGKRVRRSGGGVSWPPPRASDRGHAGVEWGFVLALLVVCTLLCSCVHTLSGVVCVCGCVRGAWTCGSVGVCFYISLFLDFWGGCCFGVRGYHTHPPGAWGVLIGEPPLGRGGLAGPPPPPPPPPPGGCH